MKIQAFIFLALIGSSGAFFSKIINYFKSGPDWNNLRVHWDLNQFNAYFPQPRTEDKAIEAGFVQMSPCDDSPGAPFRGSRYIKDNEDTLILLYDKNGYIAGIQFAVDDNRPDKYPTYVSPPYLKVGSKYYVTAYFVQPDTICSRGRTEEEFHHQGTGTRLLFQNGPNPDTDYKEAPMHEEDATALGWTEGSCFYTMGVHYWYQLTVDMNCDDIYPAFLLYNGGKLTAFGWSMSVHHDGPYMEHPTEDKYGYFVKEVPKCLVGGKRKLSTMHVYLTKHPWFNWC